MTAIVTAGLTRCFGEQRAVDRIDLRVERGTFFGFLGPNGAGKSTTIKMLTGLLTPTEGTIHVLGHDMSNSQEALAAKRKIGVVPEGLALFENLNAWDSDQRKSAIKCADRPRTSTLDRRKSGCRH